MEGPSSHLPFGISIYKTWSGLLRCWKPETLDFVVGARLYESALGYIYIYIPIWQFKSSKIYYLKNIYCKVQNLKSSNEEKKNIVFLCNIFFLIILKGKLGVFLEGKIKEQSNHIFNKSTLISIINGVLIISYGVSKTSPFIQSCYCILYQNSK
jgi:hypothetical protein